MRSWLRRVAVILVVLIAGLGITALVTSRAGDRTLWPPADEAGMTVYVVSHGYHAGVVIPRALAAEIADHERYTSLSTVVQRFAAYPSIEIGWGDEGFYTQAPTLASVTMGLALRALFRPGNPSVLHVVGIPGEVRKMFPSSDIVRIDLSARGATRLLGKVNATFATTPEMPAAELGPGLYGPSLFYRAKGAFHIFNVCNHWLADLLAAAGLPSAPVLATLPEGLLFDLKWRAGLKLLPR